MDKDVWSPPPEKKKPKFEYAAPKGAVNNKKVAEKRGGYDKPWLNGVKPKTPKGAPDGKNPDGTIQKEAFLNFVYPEGRGPDEDLIRSLEKEVIEKNLNIGFDDIAELDRVKEILFETVIYPLKIPKFYQGIRKPRKGVLLFGPPGTGKTMLAKALACTAKTTFFNVCPSTLAAKWKGDSEKMARVIFYRLNISFCLKWRGSMHRPQFLLTRLTRWCLSAALGARTLPESKFFSRKQSQNESGAIDPD